MACTRAGKSACGVLCRRGGSVAPEIHGRVCQGLGGCRLLKLISTAAADDALPLVRPAGGPLSTGMLVDSSRAYLLVTWLLLTMRVCLVCYKTCTRRKLLRTCSTAWKAVAVLHSSAAR